MTRLIDSSKDSSDKIKQVMCGGAIRHIPGLFAVNTRRKILQSLIGQEFLKDFTKQFIKTDGPQDVKSLGIRNFRNKRDR